MATVGYLEGTDPRVLTKLAAKGIGTTPISNGFDSYGKYVNHLTSQDGISVVIFACLTHDVPVLLIAEESDHHEARELLGEVRDRVRLADPADLYAAVMETIS